VLIHASESAVKQHSSYAAAKSGDVDAAFDLVLKTINEKVVDSLSELLKNDIPILISVHAEEAAGINAIPEVMADFLSYMLGLEIEKSVVQANVVNHTGAGGFNRR
jgi:hypothetical protein